MKGFSKKKKSKVDPVKQLEKELMLINKVRPINIPYYRIKFNENYRPSKVEAEVPAES